MSYLNKLKITFSVVGVVMPCCGCSIKANLLFSFTERFPSVCPSVGLSVSLHHWSIITTPMTSCFLSAGKGQRRRWGGGAGGQGPLHGRVLRTGEVTAGSHVTTGLNHELDTVRVVNSSWEHWDCSVWDKRLLRGRCLHRNKDTKVSWGRRDRKHRNKNVLAAMERAQDSGCTPSARWKISAKADKKVMMCKITLTFKAHRRTKSARA